MSYTSGSPLPVTPHLGPMLDRADPESAHAEPASQAQPAPPEPQPIPRILVADDETHIRDLAELVLRNSGFEVDCARDGEEAWDRLSRNRYDLLLTDHDMPRLKGLDLIARIRKESLPLPVILMSGTIAPSSEEVPDSARPDGFLPKPFSVANLLALVCEYLGLR